MSTGLMLCCHPLPSTPRRPDSVRTRVFHFLQNTVDRIPRPDALSSPRGQQERVLHRLTVRERERERMREREREIDVEHQPLIFSYAASCNGAV